METGKNEHRALPIGIAFSKEARVPMHHILDTESEAIRAAVAHALKRDPGVAELNRTTTRRVPEIDASFVFLDADCIGMIGRYRSRINGIADAFIFIPPEAETE